MLWLNIVVSSVLPMVTAQTARVLIFSATKAFRHDSISTANAALQELGPSNNIAFDATEDATKFTDDNLANYDAILFMMNTDKPDNPILSDPQQAAFQGYLNKGGNFIGIHSASDCLQNSTFYERQIGAYFKDHPPISEATFLNVLEPDHPTVAMLPERWTLEEEVYNFKSDPRSVGARVVLTVDQSTQGGDPNAAVHGTLHPIAWYQERGAGVSDPNQAAGRSFYTALGHLSTTWQDETFLAHITAGITWVLDAKTTRAFSANAQVGNLPSSSSSASPVASTHSGTMSLPVSQATGSQPVANGREGLATRLEIAAASALGAITLLNVT